MSSLVPGSFRSFLADVFPHFSYPVLRALEPQYFDLLYEAQLRFSPGVLGENATKRLHTSGTSLRLPRSSSNPMQILLRTLLRRHYAFN